MKKFVLIIAAASAVLAPQIGLAYYQGDPGSESLVSFGRVALAVGRMQSGDGTAETPAMVQAITGRVAAATGVSSARLTVDEMDCGDYKVTNTQTKAVYIVNHKTGAIRAGIAD
jgi:hypothetical protein